MRANPARIVTHCTGRTLPVSPRGYMRKMHFVHLINVTFKVSKKTHTSRDWWLVRQLLWAAVFPSRVTWPQTKQQLYLLQVNTYGTILIKRALHRQKKNKKNFYGAKVVCCELKYILSYRVKRSVEFSPAVTPLALMESHTSRSEAPLLLPPLPSPPLPACLPACLPLPFALTRSQSHGG